MRDELQLNGGEAEAKPPGRRWLRRMMNHRGATVAAAVLAMIAAFSFVGPALSPWDESGQRLERTFEKPSARHWFGLDSLGRDLMERTMYGGRISLAVGFMGAVLSILIGVTVGGAAGFLGGTVETAIMRGIDFLYSVPLLLVVIALMVVLGQGLSNIFIALGLVYWLGMARVVRARVAELRSREFIDAARVTGAGRVSIFMRHVLPNTTAVIVVTATFMVPQAIFAESFLSFLGLGVTLPHASWGTLAADGLQARSYPHVLLFPSLAICLTMFCFQALGEALRMALDPRESGLD